MPIGGLQEVTVGDKMRNVGQWWPRVSVAGVLAVLAVAMIAGLRPEPGFAIALRSTTQSSPPVAPAAEAPVPGAILAPYTARQAMASSGDVAYALVGGALTVADIPTAALVSYQRAAAVIDLADEHCHLDWELLAALGKVLTDHGRADGSELDDRGVARPAVVGERLTGRHGTPRIADTDAGLLDKDLRLDRAVGPMLLLPSVWSVVNVDGDSDGRRNPQDIDDAALSAAVFLCAGPGDFRNASHVRSEIRRYHPGADYAKSVVGVLHAYRDAEALPTAVSVLAREEGVSVEVAPDAAPTPADPTFSGGATFVPGPSGHPTTSGPSPSTSVTPTPTQTPTASQTASASQTPSETPSSSPTPSGAPSPTATSSACPGPTQGPTPLTPTDDTTPTSGPDPCPTASPTASPTPDGGTPESAPVAGRVLAAPLPLGAVWLWWRRRRTRPSGVRGANTVV
jgi:hypothetical protein